MSNRYSSWCVYLHICFVFIFSDLMIWFAEIQNVNIETFVEAVVHNFNFNLLLGYLAIATCVQIALRFLIEMFNLIHRFGCMWRTATPPTPTRTIHISETHLRLKWTKSCSDYDQPLIIIIIVNRNIFSKDLIECIETMSNANTFIACFRLTLFFFILHLITRTFIPHTHMLFYPSLSSLSLPQKPQRMSKFSVNFEWSTIANTVSFFSLLIKAECIVSLWNRFVNQCTTICCFVFVSKISILRVFFCSNQKHPHSEF